MSTFEHNPSESIDDEIRRVPLPERLLAKLRAIALAEDTDLDEALREIPVPPGLLSRLQGIATYSDEFVEADIRDVRVPTGLVASLRTIPEYADPHVDADLCDVPVPTGLLGQLQQISTEGAGRVSVASRHRQRRSSFAQIAVAASLMLMVGVSYLTAMIGFVATAFYDPPERPTWEVIVQEPPMELQLGHVEPYAPLVSVSIDAAPEFDPAGDFKKPAIASSAIGPMPLPSDRLPENDLRPWFDSEEDRQAMLAEVVLMQRQPFASAPDDGTIPLKSVDDVKPRGALPTWVRADLLQFLLVNEVHPFVSPAAGQSFRQSRLPLVVASPSFDRAWEEVHRSNSDVTAVKDSLRRVVRTEEFIQAIDYGVATASSPVSLRVLGGPSPFGAIDARTLQIIAQGGKSANRDRRTPSHVSVLVDVSSSMLEHGNLDRTREALKEFVATLHPEDRVSLIAHCESATLLLDHAVASRTAELLAAIGQLRAQPGNNIGEAIRLAALSLNRIDDREMPQSLVIFSDGLGLVAEKSAAQLERVMSHLARGEVRVAVVDLTRGGLRDALLPRLATAGKGISSRTTTREEMVDALQIALSRDRPVVAKGVRVSVQFNPRAVASYRLLGHEPTTILDSGNRPVEIDLRADQSAAGLFEINLTPAGENHVGWVEVSWRDARTGSRQSRRQRISRIQFAPTFAEAPMPVQAAIVAAETAELLRGSPYADRPQTSLATVRELADQVDPEMAETPSFKRFVRFIDRALQIGLR
jgi:Ca-activated chloride channel family protein